jgi:hypothetical protein
MNNNSTFQVGTIVNYGGGFYRVSRSTKETVNLRGVFDGYRWPPIHKGISKSEITEAADEFMAYWQTTESYQCM